MRAREEVFWKLVAWHELTHEPDPRPIEEYDQRARDIWTLVHNCMETSGDSKLCYAAQRTLLDVLIDECHCETELFCNYMNTYHPFKHRRSLYVHPAFTAESDMKEDGLTEEAYVRSVYGNPPYDGKYASTNTIKKTLDTAERVSQSQPGFRAVYLIPLAKRRLEERLKHPNAKLLFFFPDGHCTLCAGWVLVWGYSV